MFLILPRIHFCSSELKIIVKALLESAAGIDVTGKVKPGWYSASYLC
jgi:hypothetical protein